MRPFHQCNLFKTKTPQESIKSRVGNCELQNLGCAFESEEANDIMSEVGKRTGK